MIETRLTEDERAEIENVWPEGSERLITSAEAALASLAEEIATAERVLLDRVDLRMPENLGHVREVHAAHSAIASRVVALLVKLAPAPRVRSRIERALTAEQIAYARLVAPKA